jgi:quercetin dioxygenase-like cupin family protein
MNLDEQLGIKHHFADHLYAKEMRIDAGMRVEKHMHDYTHLSILGKGRVEVKTWETDKDGLKSMLREEYKAPACIEIPANVPHQITALTNAVWYCIHATDETDPAKVDQVLIEKGRT